MGGAGNKYNIEQFGYAIFVCVASCVHNLHKRCAGLYGFDCAVEFNASDVGVDLHRLGGAAN